MAATRSLVDGWPRPPCLAAIAPGADPAGAGPVPGDRGDTDAARSCWLEALAVFDQLGDPEADEIRALLREPAAPARRGPG
ncbi:hypothetical protein [Micromonospora sp. KC723]|uniref:hypothetical protein n=1 Tax=Micromonospora sp. KC723 TaxID=2530381 RepID=UPI001046ACEE|nr:hypothetical protein [Micromonospora sp. KC723]TDB70139.1 hypothetical protein E1165_26630 [Micromonospora sp. KC723]